MIGMKDPNIALAIVSGILGGSFLGFIQYLIMRHDRRKAEAEEKINPRDFQRLLELVKAQAQERLYTLGKVYLKRGEISIREWSVYDEHYQTYADFGWNHYAKEMHDEVDKLPKTPS